MDLILNSNMYNENTKLDLISNLELDEILKIFNNNEYENLKDQKLINFLLKKYGLEIFYTNKNLFNYNTLSLENFNLFLSLLEDNEQYLNFIKANFEFLHLYYNETEYHDSIIGFFKPINYINQYLINMHYELFHKLIKSPDFIILIDMIKIKNNMNLFDYLCLKKHTFDIKLLILIENGIFNKESFNKTTYFKEIFFSLQEK